MEYKIKMKRHYLRFVLLAPIILCSCSRQGPVKRSWGRMKGLEKVVGNMNDVSYSTVRTQKPRLNARNKPVSMTDFAGRFVWAEYAAPWCNVCAWQTPETKRVEKDLGDEVVFLTVMTARSRKYNDHATVATAKSWAGKYRLDPDRVLAAKLWFKTIPEHRLYSPKGHTLFVHVGALKAGQIKKVIAFYKTGWEKWEETGVPAKWMSFQ
ncbi:MAG: thioredoxin family protein [Kiritimatiellia bacterium]